MSKKKTAGQKILALVQRGPQRGLTAAEVADRTGVKLSTVRAYLTEFKSNGYISAASTVKKDGPGRPAVRYTGA